MWTALKRIMLLVPIGAAGGLAVLHLDSTIAAQLGQPILEPLSAARRAIPAQSPYSHLETPLVLENGPLDGLAVMAGLKQRGFEEVELLRWRGSSMICEATSPRRQRLRLVVDTATGEVTGLKVLDRAGEHP